MPMEFAGLGQFAAFCEEQAMTYPERLLATAGIARMIMEKNVKGAFGDKSVLAPLSDTTIELRGGSDDPLLIDGSLLRDSIESDHGEMGTGAAAGVGSSEPILVYHEHGYITSPRSMIPNKIVPPRPAFAIGIYRSLPALREVVRVLLSPSFRIKNLRGRFSSLEDPSSMLKGVGDPANAISSLNP